MSRHEVDRLMDRRLRVHEFISRDAFLGRDLSAGAKAISDERAYRRERDAEVEARRREKLVRDGLRRLQADYFGGS